MFLSLNVSPKISSKEFQYLGKYIHLLYSTFVEAPKTCQPPAEGCVSIQWNVWGCNGPVLAVSQVYQMPRTHWKACWTVGKS